MHQLSSTLDISLVPVLKHGVLVEQVLELAGGMDESPTSSSQRRASVVEYDGMFDGEEDDDVSHGEEDDGVQFHALLGPEVLQ